MSNESDKVKPIRFRHRQPVGKIGAVAIEAVQVLNSAVDEDGERRSIEVAEVWFQSGSGAPFTEEALRAETLTEQDLLQFCKSESVYKRVGQVLFPISDAEKLRWFFNVKRFGKDALVIKALVGEPRDLARAQLGGILEP